MSFGDFDDEISVFEFGIRTLGFQILKVIIWYSKKAPFDAYGNFCAAKKDSLQAIKKASNNGTMFSGFVYGAFSGIGLALESITLVEGWFRTSVRIGAKIADEYGFEYDSISRDDFPEVIATWVGVPEYIGNESAKEALLSNEIDVLFSQKASAKLLVKVTAKIGVKLGAKTSSLIPLLGAPANASVNRALMGQLIEASETYYRNKFQKMKDEQQAE